MNFMKSWKPIIAIVALSSSVAHATTSLNFFGSFNTYVAQNLSSTTGVPTNGMYWGVLVDSGGNGIINTNEGSYDAFTPALSGTYNLSSGGVATDDYLFMAGALTVNTSGVTEGDFTTTGGTGGVDQSIVVTYSGVITANDVFYFVWFDGTKGGVLSDASFVLPADSGATIDVTAPFAGVDPVRWAGRSYAGTSGTAITGTDGGGITIIPEPTTALLASMGLLVLMRRRRD